MAAKNPDEDNAEEGRKLFESLQFQIDDHDHDGALKTCAKLNALFPDDEVVSRSRVVAAVKCGEYEKALAWSKGFAGMEMERAYCFYKQGDNQAALDAISTMPKDDPGRVQLDAQIRYRLGEYNECIDLYQSLPRDVDDAELRSNVSAAYTAAGRAANGLQHLDSMTELANGEEDEEETYELDYNRGCAFLAQGKLKAAREAFEQAREICARGLEADGYTPEEIEVETTAIRVQLAVVSQFEGDAEHATAEYMAVLKAKQGDAHSLAIASNNLVSLRGERDLFDSGKRFKTLATDKVRSKLLPTQLETVVYNQAVLLMQMGKGDECRQAIADLKKAYPSRATEAALIEVKLLQKEKNVGAAMVRLEEAISASEQRKDVEASTTFRLALAELRAADGEFEEGAAMLDKIPDQAVANSLAVVTTKTGLLRQAGKEVEAQGALRSALQWSTTQAKKNNNNDAAAAAAAAAAAILPLTLALAGLLEQDGQWEAASSLYSGLVDGTTEGCMMEADQQVLVLAKLVKALSRFDPAQAEERAEMLPAVEDEEGAEELDAAQLEASVAPSLAYAHRARLRAESRVASKEAAKEAERKASVAAEEKKGKKGKKGSAAAADAKTDDEKTDEKTVVSLTDEQQRTKEKRAKRKAALREEFLKRKCAKEGCEVKDLPAIDPERWLARRDRRDAKKRERKNRRRMGHASGGHQGGGGGEEDADASLDALARGKERKEREALEDGESKSGGGTNMGASARRSRKKKKGRR